jgi:hypothetical protein
MKSYSDAELDEFEAGTAIVVGAVEILCDPPVRVWSGYAPIDIAGETCLPIGDAGLMQVSSTALGSTDQNVTLTLSGIEPEVLELYDASEVRDAPVTAWEVVFKGDGKTFLGAHVLSRGRLDDLPCDETIGGVAQINAMVETAARGLGRRGGRMRTDADQRLIDPDDGFFKHASYAGEKTLYWGGQKPATAAQALGGGGFGISGDGLVRAVRD